jgi:6-pyruvoyltetrahydropterin/6-carboxytetrahydropterin synthase
MLSMSRAGPSLAGGGGVDSYHPAVFRLSVETTFAAAHALMIRGQREPNHGHNWHVTVTLAGERLDDDGLLVDFHLVEALLGEVVAPFRNGDLNRAAPFDRLNPSAEHVARHIAESMDRKVREALGSGRDGAGAVSARVESVRVTEAPGCTAEYVPGGAPGAHSRGERGGAGSGR